MSKTQKSDQGEAVDRLAAVYQQARLHTRRMHRCLSLAVAAGDPGAATAALVRLRDALAWEQRAQRRYERAALLSYAWWTDLPARATAAAAPDAITAAPPVGAASAA
jgi:hypothetical protein